ncbi:putative quinol monooxygenase [Pseudomonas sp. NCHU5208]|uniref:putative quinol monooxygenase n=1 Tax=unclassified Pseudomonas TaxID=196821 RepID=UPI003F97A3F5
MAKVTLKGYILVPEKDLQEVRRELINHRRLTLEESGCISFTVTESVENPLRFDVFEEFVDRQAFDFHQARVRASRWGQVTVDVARHYEVFE